MTGPAVQSPRSRRTTIVRQSVCWWVGVVLASASTVVALLHGPLVPFLLLAVAALVLSCVGIERSRRRAGLDPAAEPRLIPDPDASPEPTIAERLCVRLGVSRQSLAAVGAVMCCGVAAAAVSDFSAMLPKIIAGCAVLWAVRLAWAAQHARGREVEVVAAPVAPRLDMRPPVGPSLVWWCTVLAFTACLVMSTRGRPFWWAAGMVAVVLIGLPLLLWARRRAGLPRALAFRRAHKRAAVAIDPTYPFADTDPYANPEMKASLTLLVSLFLPASFLTTVEASSSSLSWELVFIAAIVLFGGRQISRLRRAEVRRLALARIPAASDVPA